MKTEVGSGSGSPHDHLTQSWVLYYLPEWTSTLISLNDQRKNCKWEGVLICRGHIIGQEGEQIL